MNRDGGSAGGFPAMASVAGLCPFSAPFLLILFLLKIKGLFGECRASKKGLVLGCLDAYHWLHLPMATPCSRCGATKTETVRHGLMYNLARRFGYRLRKCGRCRRLRLLPLHNHGEDHSDTANRGPNTSSGVTQTADKPLRPESDRAATGAAKVRPEVQSGKNSHRCPRCGATEFRRSRRNLLEHILFRPRMARCKRCRCRFRYPKK